ncbi:gas vesicle protein GvpG [Kitasatospora sp. NPDC048365]|uniref:gas vesicle protein GvpG n=1 Tax=Kitasatospora sp. NPDC048365 TaxID=3364050 RepID=UPI00371669A0
MGVITGLFTPPLAPVRGVVRVAERLYGQALHELNDPAVVRRLLEVQAAREAGTISEESAARQEEPVGRLWDSTRAASAREV